MPAPPVIARWINDSGDVMLFGQLVVPTNDSDNDAALTLGTQSTVSFPGPVSVVIGVPAAGVANGDSFDAVIAGTVPVRLEAGLSGLAVGQPLYISNNTDGVATNVHSPNYPTPIATVQALLADANLTLATLGSIPSLDQQLLLNPLVHGAGGGAGPGQYAIVGALGGPSGGAPGVAKTTADATYGTARPLVLGIVLSRANNHFAPLIYRGLTSVQMDGGLTLTPGQEIYLSDTGTASGSGSGTNVRPVTSGHFVVPIGVSVDVSMYDDTSLILILFSPSVLGTVIP